MHSHFPEGLSWRHVPAARPGVRRNESRGFDTHLMVIAEEANLWYHLSIKDEPTVKSLIIQRSCSDPLQWSEFSFLFFLGLLRHQKSTVLFLYHDLPMRSWPLAFPTLSGQNSAKICQTNAKSLGHPSFSFLGTHEAKGCNSPSGNQLVGR